MLTQLADAQSLHLKLVRLGQTGDVWVAQPNRLRWNRPDGTYQIDDGKQLWDINEQENQAVPGTSQYFDAAQAKLNLLQLLDVTQPQDQNAALSQLPVAQVTEDGIVCDVYRWTSLSAGAPLQLEAVVTAADRRCACCAPRSCVKVALNR